jgi:pyruvate/2-oxoglutarate dehydrogenase complex dihydrolipoamide dehydrogenase (E3) component
VVVIGGGLAGMEAARVAGLRGHEVALYESKDVLGGQWSIACKQKGKEIYSDVLMHLERALEKAGVEVVINTSVTPALIRNFNPDVVVLAAGASPQRLVVPGIEGANVVQAVDVIQGRAEVGKTAAVIGGRLIGMETALQLSESGREVSLVTARRLGQNGDKLEETVYRTLRDRLITEGARIYTGCPLFEVRQDGVFLNDDGNLLFVEAETVVLAIGSVPRNDMVPELQSIAPEIHVIGDCKKPRDALEAIHEGAEVGRTL